MLHSDTITKICQPKYWTLNQQLCSVPSLNLLVDNPQERTTYLVPPRINNAPLSTIFASLNTRANSIVLKRPAVRLCAANRCARAICSFSLLIIGRLYYSLLYYCKHPSLAGGHHQLGWTQLLKKACKLRTSRSIGLRWASGLMCRFPTQRETSSLKEKYQWKPRPVSQQRYHHLFHSPFSTIIELLDIVWIVPGYLRQTWGSIG